MFVKNVMDISHQEKFGITSDWLAHNYSRTAAQEDIYAAQLSNATKSEFTADIMICETKFLTTGIPLIVRAHFIFIQEIAVFLANF